MRPPPSLRFLVLVILLFLAGAPTVAAQAVPTEAPTAPTEAPTEAPTAPTEAPTAPTEAPTAATEASTAATRPALEMPPRMVEGIAHRDKKIVLLSMQEQFADESWPHAERRATAELRALGFEVVRVSSRTRDLNARIAELGTHAAAEHALGSVRIVRQGNQKIAQIWLHDALTGKMLLRKIAIGNAGGSNAGGSNAGGSNAGGSNAGGSNADGDDADGTDAGMRVVELVHASLLETQLRAKGATPAAIRKLVRDRLIRQRQRDSASASGSHRPAPSPPRSWAVSLAPALQLSPGESPPALALNVAVQHEITSGFALGLSLVTPLSTATITTDKGEADLQLICSQIEASYSPWPRARLSPAVALGLGLLLLRASGRATPPHISQIDWEAAFASSLELRLELRLVRGLHLRLAGGPTVGLPGLGVRMVDDRAAVLGRPLLQISLGLKWRWS